MTDFIRARSDEQKAQRLNQIKSAAERQFAERPYHQITLTTIAEELGWSRANLYKYAATKEEIFLAIMADKRDAYTNALLAALPEGCDFAPEVSAEVWSGIVNAHYDYFRYSDLLFTVIETNVSVEKLVEFKRGYYDKLPSVCRQLSSALGVPEERVEELVNTVYYHGVGLAGSCLNNPLVQQAVAQLSITPARVDFRAAMRDFILMCLEWYRE